MLNTRKHGTTKDQDQRMMKFKQCWRAVAMLAGASMAMLCLCGCVSCGQFGDSDYAFQCDLPRLEALVFKSEGSNIYGQILVPSSQFAGGRPCAIICHGFAGFTFAVLGSLSSSLTIAARGAARASIPSRAAYAMQRILHAGRAERILLRSTERTPMPSI